MKIREATKHDIHNWVEMRQKLWPDCSLEQHHLEVDEILSSAKSTALFALDKQGRILGFIEVSIRSYAEGCQSNSVGYVEGIFVKEESRRRGVSKRLFQVGEEWALGQGCFEMASDCEITNKESVLAHQKANFIEVERSIHLKKTPLLQRELDAWCGKQKEMIYDHYLESEDPRKQSGFLGAEESWVACRKPITNCITQSGSFLDIGCANGYLLESIIRWTKERGLKIEPYGIDISEELVTAARKRLPQYRRNIQLGNGFSWNPSRRFDYVRTELLYVSEEYRKAFINRLIALFLKADGTLLVTEYHSRKDLASKWESAILGKMGFRVSDTKSGYWQEKEVTRVLLLPRKLNT